MKEKAACAPGKAKAHPADAPHPCTQHHPELPPLTPRGGTSPASEKELEASAARDPPPRPASAPRVPGRPLVSSELWATVGLCDLGESKTLDRIQRSTSWLKGENETPGQMREGGGLPEAAKGSGAVLQHARPLSSYLQFYLQFQEHRIARLAWLSGRA